MIFLTTERNRAGSCVFQPRKPARSSSDRSFFSSVEGS